MDFKTYFEAYQAPLSMGAISYGSDIKDMPSDQLHGIENAPRDFLDRIYVKVEGLDDKRRIPMIQNYLTKMMGVVAEHIGYRPGGYSLPKTKIIADYTKSITYKFVMGDGSYELVEAHNRPEALKKILQGDIELSDIKGIAFLSKNRGEMRYRRSHSTGSTMWLNMNEIREYAEFEEVSMYGVLISTMVHEAQHMYQRTKRRLTTNTKDYTFQWDGKRAPEEGATDYENMEYREQPWEKDAWKQEEELTPRLMRKLARQHVS